MQVRPGARAKSIIHASLEFLIFRLKRRGATMYQISIYSITPYLWRWEIRCGGALLRCGTAHTRVAAEKNVNEVIYS
jgi:hypothetical protein